MAKEVKIAPDLEEIKREGNVFETDFNGMHIKWVIARDCSNMSGKSVREMKQCLQTAIGLAGKMWQVPYALNKSLPFPSTVFVNDKEVEYPKG